jgi:hypothetical protein
MNMKKNNTLIRLKETARLESLIASEADYDKILKQSQKIDKYIVDEMKKNNGRKVAKKILH